MRIAALLPLVFLGCSDETISGYADPAAIYRLEELNGVAVASEAAVRFPEEGRVEGVAPCNSWSATQTAPYPWIELGPIAATRRACPELDFENHFFDQLSSVTLAEVSGPVLVLTGDGVEMVFRAE
jgi:heat shock protein HslJ